MSEPPVHCRVTSYGSTVFSESAPEHPGDCLVCDGIRARDLAAGVIEALRRARWLS
jgi:hypothetical protein